ncbi:MAG: hypothetical protein LBP19_06160 [Treponema sp.]|jgi:type III secretory pathway component EscS|nr:hypothetical protein [Treponema sp.]
MNKLWSLFWRLFGAALVISIVIGCIIGIIRHSTDIVYNTIQYTFAVGVGICGIIGFAVIPVELYFEDRNQRKENRVTM